MLGSDEMSAMMYRSVDDLQQITHECVGKFNSAVVHINDWGIVLGPVMFAIEPAIRAVREGLAKLLELAEAAVENHLPVVSLIGQSFDWVNKVQRPVNELTHDKGHLAYYWDGKASSAYQDKVVVQNQAIGAVAVKADQVSKWLMEIAKYNIDYMTELTKMATDFLGEFTAAAIEAATVVEIPFAISDLAGAIGGVVSKALANLVGIAKRFVEVLGKVRDLQSYMTDQVIRGGSWPQAVGG